MERENVEEIPRTSGIVYPPPTCWTLVSSGVPAGGQPFPIERVPKKFFWGGEGGGTNTNKRNNKEKDDCRYESIGDI